MHEYNRENDLKGSEVIFFTALVYTIAENELELSSFAQVVQYNAAISIPHSGRSMGICAG